jgi:tyrosyl-tRNA synthetase
VIQKELAKDLTLRVHSEADYNMAVEASQILFGKATTETLNNISEEMFLSVFEGVPQSQVAMGELAAGIPMAEFLADKTQVFPSRGEARRMMKDGGVLINKSRVEDAQTVTDDMLIKGKYILVQKGKKNYFLVVVE